MSKKILKKVKEKNDDEIYELINRRRRQCIVHRIIYYCYPDFVLILDETYDKWERELIKLVKKYPKIAQKVPYDDICPSKCIGSSNINDYPINFVRIAQSLISYKKINEKSKKVKKIVKKKKLLKKR